MNAHKGVCLGAMGVRERVNEFCLIRREEEKEREREYVWVWERVRVRMRMRACVSEPKWSRGTQQQQQQQLKREPSQKPNLNKVRRLFLLKAKLKKEKNEEKKYYLKNVRLIFWSVLTKESLAEYWTAQPIWKKNCICHNPEFRFEEYQVSNQDRTILKLKQI